MLCTAQIQAMYLDRPCNLFPLFPSIFVEVKKHSPTLLMHVNIALGGVTTFFLRFTEFVHAPLVMKAGPFVRRPD